MDGTQTPRGRAPWPGWILPLVLLACRPDGLDAPPLEPIEVERDVPLPANVLLRDPSSGNAAFSQAFGGRLLPDAEHVLLRVRDVDDSQQLATMRLDGSDVRCVTCGAFPRAPGAEAFPDEKRLLVSVSDTGIGDIQHYVQECSPDLYDCRESVVLPIRFPIPGLPQGGQNRGVGLHPDGQHLKWSEVRFADGERMVIGRLERGENAYEVVDPRIVSPGFTLDSPQGWLDGGRYYELGEWVDGGRTLKYGTTTTALNYDIWEVDLATGRRRQVTLDLDYNELYDASPDGRSLAYASARGLDRMDVFTELVRPPYIDAVTFPQIGRVGLWNNRRCMNERWLMDRRGQRGSYAGQPVVTEDDWVIRGWSWFPDGTRALVAEERLPNRVEPADPIDRLRLRILRFPARRPTAPLPTVDLDALDLSWTVPYDAYLGFPAIPLANARIPGRHSGEAIVNGSGSFASGAWSVRYEGYSDDGRSFLDGTESLVTPLALLAATWTVDLTSRGDREGRLQGELVVSGPGRFEGSVESEVNGISRSGVPVQDDCPGVRQAPLAFENLRATPIGFGLVLVTARIVAVVPEDPVHRPVRLAKLSVGGRTAESDRFGRARLVVRAPRGVDLAVSASAGGFRSTEGTVLPTR